MTVIHCAFLVTAALLVSACEPQATQAPQAARDQTSDAVARAGNASASMEVTSSPAGAPTSADGAHEWFAADSDFAHCHHARAPAERIQTIKESGYDPVINEGTASDGAMKVEVGAPNPDGLSTTYVTYYRSLAGCEQALQEQNSVPTRYQ